MNQSQRMAPVGTDKELSDLLDFSMMFPLPVPNGKGRPAPLATGQFGGSALEDRPSSGSWGPGEQNSTSFDTSRAYGASAHFSEPPNGLPASTFVGPGLGDAQPKKVRKVPPGLPSSVYPSSSGEDYSRDPTYPPSKTPSSTYPTPFYMPGALTATVGGK